MTLTAWYRRILSSGSIPDGEILAVSIVGAAQVVELIRPIDKDQSVPSTFVGRFEEEPNLRILGRG